MFDLPSLEPSSLPGFFWITNRRFTQPNWVIAGLTGISISIVVLGIVVAMFDPDPIQTDNWLADHGLPPDHFDSHYLHGAFLESHRCMVSSIKLSSFHWCMVIGTLPFFGFVAWRLKMNTQRTQRRAKEQEEFAEALEAERNARAVTNNPDLESHQRITPSVAVASSSSSPPNQDMDELSAVKVEMTSALMTGVIAVALSVSFMSFAYAWVTVIEMVAYFTLWAASSLHPLLLANAMSQRHRKEIKRAREASVGQKYSGEGNQLVHHRLLYRLKHVLKDAHCYPLFLRFLQKEYSSENALFYLESKKYAMFCKQLEGTIPGWTSRLDLDDSDDHSTTIHHTLGAATIQSEQTILVRNKVSVIRNPSLCHDQPVTAAVADVATPFPSTIIAINAPTISWQQQQQIAPIDQGIELAPTSSPLLAVAAPTDSTADLPPSSIIPMMHPQVRLLQTLPVRSSSVSLTSSPSLSHGSSNPATPNPTTEKKRLIGARSNSVVSIETILPPPRRSLLMVQSTNETSLVRDHGIEAITLPGSVSTTQQQQQQQANVASSAIPVTSLPLVSPVVSTLSCRSMHEMASQARTWALKLHTDYLQANAVFQVNIDSGLARMVTMQIRQLEQWQPSPLDDAGQVDLDRAAADSLPPSPPPFPLSSLYRQTTLSIFMLMETDSFRRFLLTSDFHMLLQRSDEEEVARLEKQPNMQATTQAILDRAESALAGK